MNIREVTTFKFPREMVFRTIRDRYEDYLKYTTIVSKVKLIEEKSLSNTTMSTITEWEVKARIPMGFRHLIKPQMICWRVHTLWDMARWTCNWRMETFYFKEIFECYGAMNFKEKKSELTEVILAAMFHIDVPILGLAAEKFIVKHYLNKNLMLNNSAIRRLLDEEKSAHNKGT